nr:class I tRNA ligase family protein [Dolichospermum heterosporum]
MTVTIPNLPSLYEAFSTEAKWQKFWEDNQVYKADPNHKGEPYCIVIPPPNVTGSLHMGHAFEGAIIGHPGTLPPHEGTEYPMATGN